MDQFDNRVKKEILNHTEDTPSTLKDEIWSHIDHELFQKKSRKQKKTKKESKFIPTFIAAAAGVIILFSTQTEQGSEFIKQAKNVFVPEEEIVQNSKDNEDIVQGIEDNEEETNVDSPGESKQIKDMYPLEKDVILKLEGTEEKTIVTLQEGKDSAYIIYIDEEHYQFAKGDESDFITPSEPLSEEYPEVSMEIKQFKDVTSEEMVSTLETELASDYTRVTETESVTEPVEGFKIHGISGSEWDSPVTNVYVVDNLNGGSFVITEIYFLEAAEGHGARFYAMLQEFEIVE